MTLTLEISKDSCFDMDYNGVTVSLHNTYFYDKTLLTLNKIGYGFWPPSEIQQIAVQCKKLEIILRNNKSESPIILNEKVQSVFLKFLQEGRPHKDYCCFDFVNSLHSKYQILNCINPYEWNRESYVNAESIRTGDAIFFSSSGKPQHAAIYLDAKIYVSLFGRLGPLIFCSMESLKTLYPSDVIEVWKPK